VTAPSRIDPARFLHEHLASASCRGMPSRAALDGVDAPYMDAVRLDQIGRLAGLEVR
jgi:hypothetical protein